jgi:RNA polymerase sigma factor for flagellar operon FliA
MNGVAAYSEVAVARDDDADLMQHASLVKRIAYHLLSRLPPSVLLEDLVQVGMVGLIEAYRNYDAEQGASFETYAGIRIRGAMLDEIRRSDWTPRSVHRKSREVAEAIRRVENRMGRDAKDVEIATELDISLDEYHQILQDSLGSRVLSIDEMAALGMSTPGSLTDEAHGPAEGIEREAFKAALMEAITRLPERERLIISLYYGDELNLREIGEVMGVTESRVCQIHSQAAARLRSKLADWLGDSGSAKLYARAT